MSFRLHKEESVEKGIHRILYEQLECFDDDLHRHRRVEAIHEARKRCKRLRATLRLLRPMVPALYEKKNGLYREWAHALSAARDADVRVVAFQNLVRREENGGRHFSSLRSLLDISEKGKQSTTKTPAKMFASEIKEARWELRHLNRVKLPKGMGFRLIEKGLHQTYKQGRHAMIMAYDRNEPGAFHRWRRRVKDLGYHLQLLRELWPPILKQLRKEFDALGDLLGDEHDLVMLREILLTNSKGRVPHKLLESFLGLLDRRVFELEAEAQSYGRRLYSEKPKDFMNRFKTYWDTWQAEISASLSSPEPALPRRP